MKTILLHPTYFPSIEQMAYMAKADKVVWEFQDNYQKQTYRNRAYIAHSNGKLLLNIPMQHKRGERQKTKDVLAVADFPWQSQHFKSLQIAYRTSPYFEFYEDDLEPLFLKPVNNIIDHNTHITSVLCELIGMEFDAAKTDVFEKNPDAVIDLRFLVDAKRKSDFTPTPYIQVLEDAHGFLPNLSILDLLFNEGPNTLNYLEQQTLPVTI